MSDPEPLYCPQCAEDLPYEVTEYGGMHDPVLHPAAVAYHVTRTERVEIRHGVPHDEYHCARGHTFWAVRS